MEKSGGDFQLNIARSSYYLMIFCTTLLAALVILHALGFIAWPSQQFSDAQTTPFVYGALLVSVFGTYRLRHFFAGIRVTDTTLKHVTSKLGLLAIKPTVSEVVYDLNTIKRVLVAPLSFFNDTYSEFQSEALTTLLDQSESRWMILQHGLVLFVETHDGRSLVLPLSSVSTRKIDRLVAELQRRGLLVQRPA